MAYSIFLVFSIASFSASLSFAAPQSDRQEQSINQDHGFSTPDNLGINVEVAARTNSGEDVRVELTEFNTSSPAEAESLLIKIYENYEIQTTQTSIKRTPIVVFASDPDKFEVSAANAGIYSEVRALPQLEDPTAKRNKNSRGIDLSKMRWTPSGKTLDPKTATKAKIWKERLFPEPYTKIYATFLLIRVIGQAGLVNYALAMQYGKTFLSSAVNIATIIPVLGTLGLQTLNSFYMRWLGYDGIFGLAPDEVLSPEASAEYTAMIKSKGFYSNLLYEGKKWVKDAALFAVLLNAYWIGLYGVGFESTYHGLALMGDIFITLVAEIGYLSSIDFKTKVDAARYDTRPQAVRDRRDPRTKEAIGKKFQARAAVWACILSLSITPLEVLISGGSSFARWGIIGLGVGGLALRTYLGVKYHDGKDKHDGKSDLSATVRGVANKVFSKAFNVLRADDPQKAHQSWMTKTRTFVNDLAEKSGVQKTFRSCKEYFVRRESTANL